MKEKTKLKKIITTTFFGKTETVFYGTWGPWKPYVVIMCIFVFFFFYSTARMWANLKYTLSNTEGPAKCW